MRRKNVSPLAVSLLSTTVLAATLSAGLYSEAQERKRRMKKRSCLGTEFGGPHDRWAGKTYRCLGIPTKTPGVRGAAHRWLPCGTKLTITYRNRKTGITRTAVDVPVVDRGPYGALLPKGATRCPKLYGTKYPRRWCKKRKDGRIWVVKLHYEEPGTWQGCLDLTRKVVEDLDPDSKPGRFYERVHYRYDLPLRRPGGET